MQGKSTCGADMSPSKLLGQLLLQRIVQMRNPEIIWDVGASWAMYANNCYISHQDAYAIVAAGKCVKDANAIVAATIATMQL